MSREHLEQAHGAAVAAAVVCARRAGDVASERAVTSSATSEGLVSGLVSLVETMATHIAAQRPGATVETVVTSFAQAQADWAAFQHELGRLTDRPASGGAR